MVRRWRKLDKKTLPSVGQFYTIQVDNENLQCILEAPGPTECGLEPTFMYRKSGWKQNGNPYKFIMGRWNECK
jgi:hypothetical protein